MDGISLRNSDPMSGAAENATPKIGSEIRGEKFHTADVTSTLEPHAVNLHALILRGTCADIKFLISCLCVYLNGGNDI